MKTDYKLLTVLLGVLGVLGVLDLAAVPFMIAANHHTADTPDQLGCPPAPGPRPRQPSGLMGSGLVPWVIMSRRWRGAPMSAISLLESATSSEARLRIDTSPVRWAALIRLPRTADHARS